MIRELRTLRSVYQLVQTENRIDTIVAAVTLAVVVGPILLSWLQSYMRPSRRR